MTTTEIVKSAGPALITLTAFDETGRLIGQGSGFIVRQDGVVVTNWHVLVGATTASVILKTGEVFKRVEFLDGDEDADVALIKVPGIGLPSVSVTPEIPEVGERIVAVGSPLGLSETVSEGIVSAIRTVDGRQMVQITAPISPGSSGGAIMDGRGRVFAIATSILREAQQINFAVPVKYAMGLLGVATKTRGLQEVFAGRATPTSA